MRYSYSQRAPLKFFLYIYGLSLPFWIIELFINVKGLPLEIPITDIAAAFTPLAAACILIYKEEGGEAVNNLLRRIFDYSRIEQKQWYLPIFFLPFLMFITIYFVMKIMKLELPVEWSIPYLSIPFLLIFFFLGAVAEEVGYMGYAVDPLQKKWNALSTSIIIGLPWAIWHYPSIIKQGHDFIWILWGTLGTVAMRILIVWIYNNTGKSLFACIFFHTMYNLGRPLFPKNNLHNPLVDFPEIHYSVMAITAVIVILLWNYKTFTHFIFSNHSFKPQ